MRKVEGINKYVSINKVLDDDNLSLLKDSYLTYLKLLELSDNFIEKDNIINTIDNLIDKGYSPEIIAHVDFSLIHTMIIDTLQKSK